MCFIYLLFSNSTCLRVKYSTTLLLKSMKQFLNCTQSVYKSKQNMQHNAEKVLGRELIEWPDFTIFAKRTQTPTQPLLKITSSSEKLDFSTNVRYIFTITL